MKQVPSTKSGIRDIPQSAGVYQFISESGEVLYVGKAKNLSARVKSYFQSKLEMKTAQMVKKAVQIRYIEVPSEFEALLLEARLVKKYQPRYNIELRDDKSPLYIGITRETYPRILLLRQKELVDANLKISYGPFVSARAARQILRRIRKIIPYSTHIPTRRVCVYKELGLCDPCPSEIAQLSVDDQTKAKTLYRSNIVKIKKILSGNSTAVARIIESEMKTYALREEYESAQKSRSQLAFINSLTTEFEPTSEFIKNPNLIEDIHARELADLSSVLKPYLKVDSVNRIECYDVAHLSGTHPTASMVTFIGGVPDKSLYRHFRVSRLSKNNDVESLKQVLTRRIKHLKTWGEPDLMLIDGGKGQVAIAREVIPSYIPVVGLAKRYETLVIKTEDGFVEHRVGRRPALYLVQRLRDEAHRFARKYHHSLVTKALIEAGKKV